MGQFLRSTEQSHNNLTPHGESSSQSPRSDPAANIVSGCDAGHRLDDVIALAPSGCSTYGAWGVNIELPSALFKGVIRLCTSRRVASKLPRTNI